MDESKEKHEKNKIFSFGVVLKGCVYVEATDKDEAVNKVFDMRSSDIVENLDVEEVFYD